MINKHKSNKIKENSNTVRHLNNGTDHRHSKSCCDQSSPARRTTKPGNKTAVVQWSDPYDVISALWFESVLCARNKQLQEITNKVFITKISDMLMTCRCRGNNVLELSLADYCQNNHLLQTGHIGDEISVAFNAIRQTHKKHLIPRLHARAVRCLMWGF